MTLTRDQLLKPKTKTITIPDIGEISIRKLSTGDALRFQEVAKANGGKESPEMILDLVASCVVDDSGKPMLSKEDVASLDMELITPIMLEIVKFNGLSETALEEATASLKNMQAQSG